MREILITGCYRSGTEYFTHLLNSHPEISVYSYATNFMRYYYNRYGDVSLKKNYQNLLKDAEKIINTRIGIKINKDKVLENCSSQEISYGNLYSSLIKNLYSNIKHPIKYWGEKNQLVWTKIPEFFKIFPNSKSIIMIRDPRSVLCSFKKITNAPTPLYLSSIFNTFDSMQYVIKYEKEYPSNFMYVRYEDLISSKEKTMKSVFLFLGLDYNSKYIKNYSWKNLNGTFWQHNSAFLNGDTREKFFEDLDNPKWKSELERWEIKFCEEINEKYMRAFNYLIDSEIYDYKKDFNFIKSLHNKEIYKYLSKWKSKFKGIEKFPSDPLDPKNWNSN